MTEAATLEYSDADHKYYADGRELMNVTSVLAAAGLVSPFAIDEAAAMRGRKVHELTALDDGEGVDLRTVPVPLRGYIRAWRKYREDSGFAPVLIEHRVDDLKTGYAGRFDRVGYRSDQTLSTIIDLKTGVVPDYTRYQLAAYAHALRPNQIYERIGVRVSANGTYNCKVFPVDTFRADLGKFLQMLRTAKTGGE